MTDTQNTIEIDKILHELAGFPVPQPPAGSQPNPAREFDPCAPPSLRTPPQFLVPFRRAMVFPDLCLPVDLAGTSSGDPDNPHPPRGQLLFNCAKPTGVTFCVALDLRLEQVWNLIKLSIGDLSSTMTLAPLEELVLEFQVSQRRVLEQTRVDSAEEMNSTESTTIDKEVVNTVQSLSKTQQWHVDGSASYGITSALSVKASAGLQQSTTETAQTTIDHTSEVTNKSAHNLKTLHKVEVHGVTEAFVQNRLTRKVRNPYFDQTLSLNVFQLLKHFDVETRLIEVRPIFLIQIQGLVFDGDFVQTQTDFLRDALLDAALIDELPVALSAVSPLPGQNLEKARDAAKQALHYLFDEDPIFNIRDGRGALPRNDGGQPLLDPANSPQVGFDAGLNFNFPGNQSSAGYVPGFTPPPATVLGFPAESGIADAVTNNLGGHLHHLGLLLQGVRRHQGH